MWHNGFMRTRSSKGDAAQNALRVVETAIGGPLKPKAATLQFPRKPKTPAAVALDNWVASKVDEQGLQS